MRGSRKREWRPPEPVCIFIVACGGVLPNILSVVNDQGAAHTGRRDDRQQLTPSPCHPEVRGHSAIIGLWRAPKPWFS